VFYPLRISTLEQGETKVDLLVFTPTLMGQFTGLPKSTIQQQPVVNVSLAEVEALEESWRGFFAPATPQPELTMNQWAIEGDIGTFAKDVKAR